MDNKETSELLDEVKGKFGESLVRSNSKIKRDRAISIIENAEMRYKRTVEDLALDIKAKKREREAMLDMSPTNTDSLILAVDFNAKEWVDKEIKLGREIRDLEITLEIAQKRYALLFTEGVTETKEEETK